MDSKIQLRVTRSQMPQKIRQVIMDCIREVLALEYKDEEQLRALKQLIQKNFDGKWQVVKGIYFTAFFQETTFKYFIEIEMKNWKYMIFSKSSSENPSKRER